MTFTSSTEGRQTMKKATGVALFALLTIWSAPAAAQQIPYGLWSGTMTPPGAQPIPVSFRVEETEGALSIVMMSAMVEGDMPFQDVRMEGDELTFWWDPGVRVECTLRRIDSGGLEGPCSDGREDGVAGAISMVPPGA